MKKISKKGKILLSIGIIILLIGGGGIVYSQMTKKNVQQQQIPLYNTPVSQKVFINGVIEPKETKSFGKENTNGVLINLQVQSGDKVEKGQHLFSYKNEGKEEEAKGIKSEVSDLQSDLSDAKKQLQQLKKPAPIVNDEGVEEPSPDLMDYEANKEALNAQIADLTKQIKRSNSKLSTANNEVYTKVVAPFTGVVHLDESKPDAFVTIDSSVFIMNGTVSEQDLVKVKTGMTANIFVFSTKENIKGKVETISTRPTEGGGGEGKADVSYYPVKLSFEQAEKLISGLHTQAKVQLEAVKIEVPETAILDENDKTYVFVDKGGIATKTEVKTKVEDGKFIVTEGLGENMSIVQDVQTSKVTDGMALYPGENDNE